MTPGAEPIELAGESTHSVLLLHGFGDTPQAFTHLAPRIHSAGYRVHAPLYPGHGTSPEDFFESSAEDWMGRARRSLRTLQDGSESVSIVGLSMGAAIGAVLAADNADVSSLVMISPYLQMPMWLRLAVKIRRVWGPFAGAIRASHPRSIQDPEERARSLAHRDVEGRVLGELARVAQLARRSLPAVQAPTLVIQSRKDPRVSAAATTKAMERIGAAEKRLVLTDLGGHVLTVDYGREEVAAETLSWISGRSRATAPRMDAVAR